MCIVTVGGSGVGGHLLRRVIAAFPEARERVPGLRMIVVAGPRIDPGSLPAHDGLEILPYVHELYRHLAVCDLAVVQGGLTTTMELTANRRPFIYFPLRHHFEQNFHVRHRLERYRAGRCMDYATAGPGRHRRRDRQRDRPRGRLPPRRHRRRRPRRGAARRAALRRPLPDRTPFFGGPWPENNLGPDRPGGNHDTVEHLGTVKHLDTAALQAGLGHVRESPPDHGTVEMIVRRPAVDEREVLAVGTLDADAGLVGDTWQVRGSSRTPDGSAHPGMQLTVINSRAALLVAQDPDRRMLAGDQLYVDLDLSPANLPAGTRLAVGSAVIEVSEEPHLGCAKFAARFGEEALRFVNSRVGRGLRLRGLNARILTSGTVRPGDRISKLAPARGGGRRGGGLS